jgi:hypothetical protein
MDKTAVRSFTIFTPYQILLGRSSRGGGFEICRVCSMNWEEKGCAQSFGKKT